MDKKNVLNICESEYMVLSNFSSHEVEFGGRVFKTAEHCYHFCRYGDEDIKNQIEHAKSAREAWSISQKYKKYQKEGFEEEKISLMKTILQAKLEQHEDVEEVLRKSGNNVLVKIHISDNFWGTGEEGTGHNILGKLWMEIRQEMFGEK